MFTVDSAIHLLNNRGLLYILSIETTVEVRSDMHCACTALEEELTLVEELTTHDPLSWIKVKLL